MENIITIQVNNPTDISQDFSLFNPHEKNENLDVIICQAKKKYDEFVKELINKPIYATNLKLRCQESVEQFFNPITLLRKTNTGVVRSKSIHPMIYFNINQLQVLRLDDMRMGDELYSLKFLFDGSEYLNVTINPKETFTFLFNYDMKADYDDSMDSFIERLISHKSIKKHIPIVVNNTTSKQHLIRFFDKRYKIPKGVSIEQLLASSNGYNRLFIELLSREESHDYEGVFNFNTLRIISFNQNQFNNNIRLSNMELAPTITIYQMMDFVSDTELDALGKDGYTMRPNSFETTVEPKTKVTYLFMLDDRVKQLRREIESMKSKLKDKKDRLKKLTNA